MWWRSLWVFLLLLQTFGVAKSIHLTLSSPHLTVTPLVNEIAEFVAALDSSEYWDFISHYLEHLPSLETDLAVFDFSLKFVLERFGEASSDALKLSVASHFYRPRVAMYAQTFREHVPQDERGLGECNAIIYTNEEFFCGLTSRIEEDIRILGSSEDPDNPEDPGLGLRPVNVDLVKNEHIFPNDEFNHTQVILYGVLGSSELTTAYRRLLQLAKENPDFGFTFRPVTKMHFDEARPRPSIQGYGIELAIKNTEYKVLDDTEIRETVSVDQEEELDMFEEELPVEGYLFPRLIKHRPDLTDQLTAYRDSLVAASSGVDDLKAGALSDLGLQASQQITRSSDPFLLLRDFSQNMPRYAIPLAKMKVDPDLMKEIDENQKTFRAGTNWMLINGVDWNSKYMDLFGILKFIQEESKWVDSLTRIGVRGKAARQLLKHSIGESDTANIRVDMRAIKRGDVLWVNNMREPKYRNFPSDPSQIGMYKMHSQQFVPISQNLYNTIWIIRPSDIMSFQWVMFIHDMKSRMGYMQRLFRIGIVLSAEDDDELGTRMIDLFGYVKKKSQLNNPAAEFFNSIFEEIVELHKKDGTEVHDLLNKEVVDKVFKKTQGISADDALATVTIPAFRNQQKAFLKTKGLDKLSKPTVMINGRPVIMEGNEAQTNFHQELLMEQNFYEKEIANADDELKDKIKHLDIQWDNWIYEVADCSTSYSTLVEELSSEVFVDSIPFDQLSYLGALHQDHTSLATLVATLDLSKANGIASLLTLVEAVEASIENADKKVPPFRVAVLNTAEPHSSSASDLASHLIATNEKLEAYEELLKEDSEANCSEECAGTSSEDTRKLALQILPTAAEGNYLILNGKVLATRDDENPLSVTGVISVVQTVVSQTKRLEEVMSENLGDVFEDPDDATARGLSDRIAASHSLLMARSREGHQFTHIDEFQDLKKDQSFISHDTGSAFEVTAVIDPVSAKAQMLSSLLVAFRDLGFAVNIVLNPSRDLAGLPVKRYYRFVFDPKVHFDKKGKQVSQDAAVFNRLPGSTILTLEMLDYPGSWLVERYKADYDLDNLRMNDLPESSKGMQVEFSLQHILVQGQCLDDKNRNTAGLQLELLPNAWRPTEQESEEDVRVDETMVMKVVGYFQLKASPGMFNIQILDKEQEDYAIDFSRIMQYGAKASKMNGSVALTVDSFTSTPQFMPFLKLTPDPESGVFINKVDPAEFKKIKEESLLNSLYKTVFGESEKEKAERAVVAVDVFETIHVMSVASGHLYERFLKIMMLSVKSHTKNPLKFWFFKQFLSPQFKEFLPHFAHFHGFEVGLMEYRWPEWMHAQTEKQRIIWAYKILFLDVLFPQDLKRIIFIDADQVVRADLRELWDLDLEGKVYAYTPFCDSNKATDGMRFWKSGYWEGHLRGRPYHISALYVVDLVKFRKKRTGDSLRMVYENLSRDPNSLANLDQDLPNYAQNQIPIFSLPTEWLWCDTWCSMESLKTAKTIDLCNNPLTKEPKLAKAKRLLPEWTKLDNQGKLFTKRLLDIKEETSCRTVIECSPHLEKVRGEFAILEELVKISDQETAEEVKKGDL